MVFMSQISYPRTANVFNLTHQITLNHKRYKLFFKIISLCYMNWFWTLYSKIYSSLVKSFSLSSPISNWSLALPIKWFFKNDGRPPRLSFIVYSGQRMNPRVLKRKSIYSLSTLLSVWRNISEKMKTNANLNRWHTTWSTRFWRTNLRD